MSSSERYERRLPTLLEELSAPQTPDYFDDILGQVGRTRQRPGWTFPERWLPMSAVSEPARRRAARPRARHRLRRPRHPRRRRRPSSIIAGSQQHRVPAPFGPAANGLVAFVGNDGAIRTGNPTTGTSVVIVPGSGHNKPVFSPDGTRLAYLQVSDRGGDDIVVSSADGSSPKVITTDVFTNIRYLGWSPDAGKVIAAALPSLYVFDLAKGGPPVLLTDQIPVVGSFVSLDGFNAELGDLSGPPPRTNPVHRHRTRGRRHLPPAAVRRFSLGHPHDDQHPDPVPGSLGRAVVAGRQTDRRQPAVSRRPERLARLRDERRWQPPSAADQPQAARHDRCRAAPDLVARRDADRPHAVVRSPSLGEGIEPRPITIVDVASGAEREVGDVETNNHLAGDETTHGSLGWGWSPDGSSILETPGAGSPDEGRLLVVDTTGAVTRTGFTSSSAPSWQRTQH